MLPADRARKLIWQWPAVFSFIALLSAPAQAESSRVVRIEEHWELRLSQPDQERSAPQTTMVLSTNDGLDDLHFLFTLNHSNAPSYLPGGMQVQAWDADMLIEARTADQSGALSYANEIVRWVQRLSLVDESLVFQIVDGESETWGGFGGSDLSLQVATTLSSLNGYKPGVSLTESQVGYAENRVESLTLRKLVWVTDDGQVHEMNAPIAVDTSLDP